MCVTDTQVGGDPLIPDETQHLHSSFICFYASGWVHFWGSWKYLTWWICGLIQINLKVPKHCGIVSFNSCAANIIIELE